MKETLESLRNFHNILIIVSIAGLLFSLSSKSKVNHYQIIEFTLKGFQTEAQLLEFSSFLDEKKKPILTGQDIVKIFNNTTINRLENLFLEVDRIEKTNLVDKENLVRTAAVRFLLSHATDSRLPTYIVSLPLLDSLIRHQKENILNLYAYSYFSDAKNLIQFSTLPEAIGKLKSRSEEFEKQPESIANISGFVISGKLMPFIAPIAGIFLLLYILSLISHAGSIANASVANKEIISWFPWIGLNNDDAGNWFTKISFFLLPNVSIMHAIFTADVCLLWQVAAALVSAIIVFILASQIDSKLKILKSHR